MQTPINLRPPHPRKAREACRLRQVDLASRAGCSIQTIVRCEASGKYPKIVALRDAYLRALGLGQFTSDRVATPPSPVEPVAVAS
jgi:DNA-binding XRE family transcriptional regulator